MIETSSLPCSGLGFDEMQVDTEIVNGTLRFATFQNGHFVWAVHMLRGNVELLRDHLTAALDKPARDGAA